MTDLNLIAAHIEGRLRALEYMLATAFADAVLASPDAAGSLALVNRHIEAKASDLMMEAELAGVPAGVPIATFATSLLGIRNLMVELAAAGSARTDQPPN